MRRRTSTADRVRRPRRAAATGSLALERLIVLRPSGYGKRIKAAADRSILRGLEAMFCGVDADIPRCRSGPADVVPRDMREPRCAQSACQTARRAAPPQSARRQAAERKLALESGLAGIWHRRRLPGGGATQLPTRDVGQPTNGAVGTTRARHSGQQEPRQAQALLRRRRKRGLRKARARARPAAATRYGGPAPDHRTASGPGE